MTITFLPGDRTCERCSGAIDPGVTDGRLCERCLVRGKAVNDETEYGRIPPLVREAIDKYVNQGIPPGGFTLSVLRNELFEAIGQADIESVATLTLPVICRYLWNECPAPCSGSPEKVNAWLARFK